MGSSEITGDALGRLLPDRPVTAWEVEVCRDGSVAFVGSEPVSVRPLPAELVLRGLLDLDVEDPQAVLAFVARHGAIPRRFSLFGSRGSILQNEGTWALCSPVCGTHQPGEIMVDLDRFDLEPEAAKLAPTWSFVHDLQAWLAAAQVLTRHLVAHLDGDDPRAAWPAPHWGPTSFSDPWDDWADAMNQGLLPYSPRVQDVLAVDALVAGRDTAPRPDLFSALCAQLYNIAAEALPIRRCRNERCGARFVRQAGAADRATVRTAGTAYCSPRCASAQMSRESRRRAATRAVLLPRSRQAD